MTALIIALIAVGVVTLIALRVLEEVFKDCNDSEDWWW